LPRHACFFAQQAAEKTIKAALRHEGINYGKTHDLEALRAALPLAWAVSTQPTSLTKLADWVVEARYLDNVPDATDIDARLAVQQATEVWILVAGDLYTRGFDVAVELP
jgi:HEPN domain-containing protein